MRNLIILSMVFLVACSGGADVVDLEQFVADTSSKPRGKIQPLPEFKPYSAFIYSASAMRAPFESPVAFEAMSSRFEDSVDAPDEDRRKGPLERYSIGELNLVGTMAKESDDLSALIQTSSGGVHLLNVGDHLGKNHGRIIKISDSKIELVEVVPNGNGGWISRPHSMGLKESAGSE